MNPLAPRWVAALLVPLALVFALQRGLAEAHHNHDAPLTIEAPFDLSPSDLALSAYPAVVRDPLQETLASVLAAPPIVSRIPAGPDPRGYAVHFPPDSSRAPPRS
jgi:hypothetical protein